MTGNSSKASLILMFTALLIIIIAPAALGAVLPPSNLVVSASTANTITLSWVDNANNEHAYHVQRYDNAAGDFVTISPGIGLAMNTQSYVDTGLTPGTTYQYRVYATSTWSNMIEYSGFSNTATGVTTGAAVLLWPPAAPSDLVANTVSDTEIALFWLDNASDEDSYTVERQESGTGVWGAIATLGPDSTSYSDPGLAPGTTYFYRVFASNGAGNSTISNTTSAITLGFTNPTLVQTEMKFFQGSTQYTVNGAVQTMDVAPVEQPGRILLPIRYVVEPLGLNPVWDGVNKATIQNATTTIELWLNQNTARVNGVEVLVDPDNPAIMPVSSGGRIFMPLRFVAENLGCSAVWDPGPPGTATINNPAIP